jgi:hypothetical protein
MQGSWFPIQQTDLGEGSKDPGLEYFVKTQPEKQKAAVGFFSYTLNLDEDRL